MKRSVAQILDDALALGEDDRAKLVADLTASLDGDMEEGVEEAWQAEIERRLAAIDAGQAKLLPMDEALALLRDAVRAR